MHENMKGRIVLNNALSSGDLPSQEKELSLLRLEALRMANVHGGYDVVERAKAFLGFLTGK